MKKYATAAGNVNVDFVIKIDGAAFTSVFNPRAAGGNYSNSNASKAVETKESDMPF
jgi:hypothetical protein